MNRVLAQLSTPAFERLSPHLEPVELPPGARIYEAGSTEDSLYFVGTGIVSLVKVAGDGSPVAIAIVGSEGVVGLEMFTGGMIAGWRIVVHSPLRAFRLGADALHRELSLDGELEQLLLRFTEALMCQMSQTVLCGRRHSIEQQVCRGLLAIHDRLGTRDIVMTHALIASMLGVRREAVSTVAARLKGDGLIRYKHGCVTVLRRDALESRACECYAAVKTAYQQLLGGHRT